MMGLARALGSPYELPAFGFGIFPGGGPGSHTLPKLL